MDLTYVAQPNTKLNKMVAYKPGKPIDEVFRDLGIRNAIKLASNENPLGASPQAIIALRNNAEKIHFYPDDNAYELKNALTQHWQVNTDQLTLGAGSDQLLWLIAQTFIEPGHEVLLSQYSFTSYYNAAQAANAHVVVIPMINWHYDFENFAKAITANTRLIYLANPNNPTGTWINQLTLIAFLQLVPKNIIIVIDEAYHEYVTEADYPNTIALQKLYPNLVITRTFSKIYGLAGLRVGYCIAHPSITVLLNKMRNTFNVNSAALAAATAALKDQEHLQSSLHLNKCGLQQLQAGLNALNLAYLPSVSNFIMVNFGKSAAAVYRALLNKGVIVRPLDNYGLSDYLRITVGLPEQNETLIEMLKLILAKN